jgi:hypothetical protein
MWGIVEQRDWKGKVNPIIFALVINCLGNIDLTDIDNKQQITNRRASPTTLKGIRISSK